MVLWIIFLESETPVEVMERMICDWMAEVIDENIGYLMFLSFFNPEQVKGLCSDNC